MSENSKNAEIVSRALSIALEAHKSGNIGVARNAYIQILNAAPNTPDALHLLGVTYYQTGDYKQSVALIGKAIELNPHNVSYLNNIGNALIGLNKLDTAVIYYKKAIALDPSYIEAINNCGAALNELGLWQAEIALYKDGIKHCNNYVTILPNLIKAMQNSCLWENLEKYIQELLETTKDQLKQNKKCTVSPYLSLCLPFTLEEQYKIAKNYAATFEGQNVTTNYPAQKSNKKLRIGYVSADFRDHPTAHLIVGLLKNHNRNNFEIFAYSTGKDDGSEFRKNIISACDHFVDIANISDQDAAATIKAHNIDILMDVMGYIQNSRPGIFALRPANTQINYLAYPGTMGASFIDYIITDKNVLKDEDLKHFSERPIYMPHTYFATDPSYTIANSPSKTECRLPDDKFIFCCFNKSSKIDTQTFDSWAKILNIVPNSILWLLAPNKYTKKNLRKEAKKRGIAADRLVFADRLPKSQHLARLRNADLFLDCFNICAHTTAIDALFAGVPVITKYGDKIISRASASILNAIELQELVTESIESYESLTVELATNQDKLLELRNKLSNKITTAPLFNIHEYTKNLENCIITAVNAFSLSEQS